MIKKVAVTLAWAGAGVGLYTGAKWLAGGFDRDEEEEEYDEEEEDGEEESGEESSEEEEDSLAAFNRELSAVKDSLGKEDKKAFDLALSQIKNFLVSLDGGYRQRVAATEISHCMLLAMAARNSSRRLSRAFGPHIGIDMLDVATPRLEEAVTFSGGKPEEVEQTKAAVRDFLSVLRKTTLAVQAS